MCLLNCIWWLQQMFAGAAKNRKSFGSCLKYGNFIQSATRCWSRIASRFFSNVSSGFVMSMRYREQRYADFLMLSNLQIFSSFNELGEKSFSAMPRKASKVKELARYFLDPAFCLMIWRDSGTLETMRFWLKLLRSKIYWLFSWGLWIASIKTIKYKTCLYNSSIANKSRDRI